jgi:hypothetical protein
MESISSCASPDGCWYAEIGCVLQESMDVAQLLLTYDDRNFVMTKFALGM